MKVKTVFRQSITMDSAESYVLLSILNRYADEHSADAVAEGSIEARRFEVAKDLADAMRRSHRARYV